MEDLLMYYEGYEADYIDSLEEDVFYDWQEEAYSDLENWYDNGFVGDYEEEDR